MANILLVDDDDDLRRLITIILRRKKHTVKVAGNVDDAIKQLDSNSVDLIITDLILPGTNGVDFIFWLKKRNIDARIIAISGGGNDGPAGYQPNAIMTTAYLEAAVRAGADAVLTKPFQPNELIEVVKNTLNVYSM